MNSRQPSIRKKLLIVSRDSEGIYLFRKRLLTQARQMGFDVTVIADDSNGFASRIREHTGARFISVSIPGRQLNPFAEIRLTIRLYRLFKREQADVIHLFTIRPVIFGGVAARLARIPVRVSTITGLGYAFTAARPAIKKLASALYRTSLSGMGWTFFQNGDDMQLFQEQRITGVSRSSVVPGSGVDIEHYTSDPGRVSKASDSVTVLLIGRILRDKGIVEYLQAASILKSRGLGVNCELLGGFDASNPSSISRELLQQFIDDGVVTWHGKTDDVRPFIESADIVVLPSYREGTPRSLLEAAALGKPIVATDVPGCRDVVVDGKTGVLVPARDAERLADAIATLAGDSSLRAEYGANGREMVRERYDERIVVELTLDKYSELLNQSCHCLPHSIDR